MAYKMFGDITDEVLDPVSFYLKKLDNNFGMHRHLHGYYEIMYCIEGNFLFEYSEDGKNYTTINVNPKEFIFINAGLRHSIYFEEDDNAVICNVELKPQKRTGSILAKADSIVSVNFRELVQSMRGLRHLATLPFIHTTDDENVKWVICKLVEMLAAGEYDDIENAVCIKNLIVLLLIEIGKSVKNLLSDTGIVYIKKAGEYIRNNCFENFSIEEMAAYAGVSKAYLQRIYKAYTGNTVMETVTRLRVEYGCNLLISTAEPIKRITRQCGFGTQQQFINVFKKAMGITPSEYRRNAGETIADHSLEPYESIKQDFRKGKVIEDGSLH